jgi:hypothetical protein
MVFFLAFFEIKWADTDGKWASASTDAGFVAHLYSEREVEQAAWEKYGGPERYAAQYVSFPSKSFLYLKETFLTPCHPVSRHSANAN